MDKSRYLKVVEDNAGLMADLSDKIWDAAETLYKEETSAKLLSDALEEAGFTVERGVAGIPTAFTASFGSGKPVIAVLGEYDALPGLSQVAGATEKTPLVEGGNGHGCGHNLLGAGCVGAVLGIKKYIEETGKGKVIYYGCPAEEGGAGKVFMTREHLFDEVDASISWHPSATNSISVDSFLANYSANFKFKGVSSHAAIAPHMGRSALDAVELMNVGVQFLREHVIQEARIHYAILNAGGMSPNVVQPYAEVQYLIRAPKLDQVLEIVERVKKIAEGAALMTETTVEVEFVKAMANVIPNRALAEVMANCAQEIPCAVADEEDIAYAKALNKGADPVKCGGFYLSRYRDPKVKDQVIEMLKGQEIAFGFWPLMDTEGVCPASSDLGDVSWVTPLAQICSTTCAISTVSHSWQQVAQGKSGMAHKGTLYAAKVLASTGIELIEHPEYCEKAKKELASRLNGVPYVSPIPADMKPPVGKK